MNSFWDLMLASLIKDIRLEWRSKDALNSMLFFSLLVVVIFSFSFDPNAEESRQIAGGLVWVAFLFAAVVALNQTWAREIRNQVLDAYRVAPAPANALFLAKALGNFIFVVLLVVLLGGFALISHGGLQNVLDAQKYAAEITVTTLWMALTEAIAFVVFGFLL